MSEKASPAAAETAPMIERRVYARDQAGGVKRIPLSVANKLVYAGLADRASKAGHILMKNGFVLEKLTPHRGARANVTTCGARQENLGHHPRCGDWSRRA